MTEIQKLVSIIMPVYNRAHCIGRSIDSVLCQGYENFELVIVDDGSEDEIELLVAKYSDTRLKFHRLSQNLGVSAARNVGLTKCKGDLICFLDSDDELLPDYLEVMANSYDPNHTQILCCLAEDSNFEWLPDMSQLTYYEASSDKFGFLLRGNIFPLPCLLFSSNMKTELMFDETYEAYEDYALILQLHIREYEVRPVLQLLVKVNDSPGSLNKNYDRIISTLDLLRKQYGTFIDQSNDYRYQFYRNYFGILRKGNRYPTAIFLFAKMACYKQFYYSLFLKMLRIFRKPVR